MNIRIRLVYKIIISILLIYQYLNNMINNNYVLLNILNKDVLNNINEYMINPYIEIKNIFLDNYNKNIDKLYNNYVHCSMRKIENMRNIIQYSRDAEANDETRESISDIFYEMETITDFNLMKIQPKFKKIDIKTIIKEKFSKLII